MNQSQSSHSPTLPRIALITGAARRIGRAAALSLAARGYQVGVHYRNSENEANTLVGEIKSKGGAAVALQADLSCSRDVRSLIHTCKEKLGAPTCLINNASEFLHDSLDEMTEDIWNTHFDINLKAPVFLTRDLAKALPEGVPGNVINIIDQRVWRLTPDFFSYTISKSGLWSATQMLAQALAPHVRVNAIGPGPVLKSVHQTDADFSLESKSTLLGHGPTPEEIARAIHFIIETSSMTGQMIVLDGGQHLSWRA